MAVPARVYVTSGGLFGAGLVMVIVAAIIAFFVSGWEPTSFSTGTRLAGLVAMGFTFAPVLGAFGIAVMAVSLVVQEVSGVEPEDG